MFQEPATRRVWLFRDNIKTLYKDKDGMGGLGAGQEGVSC